jgi:hypothetical protein
VSCSLTGKLQQCSVIIRQIPDGLGGFFFSRPPPHDVNDWMAAETCISVSKDYWLSTAFRQSIPFSGVDMSMQDCC